MEREKIYFTLCFITRYVYSFICLILWFCVTISIGVTNNIITSDSYCVAAIWIRFQCSIGASILESIFWQYVQNNNTNYLIIAAPTRILEAPSIHLMSNLSPHVREVSPAVAPGIAGLHLNAVRTWPVVLSNSTRRVKTKVFNLKHKIKQENTQELHINSGSDWKYKKYQR